MQFGHEQLDVYRVSIRYVAWAYKLAKRLKRNGEVRENPGRYDYPDYDNDTEGNAPCSAS